MTARCLFPCPTRRGGAGLLALALAIGSLSLGSAPAADFITLCREKGAAAEARTDLAVAGMDGWFFLAQELRHLGVGPFWGTNALHASRATQPENADPLPAILDFHQQLKTAGIRLILLPVPAKAALYPDKLDAQLAPAPNLANADTEFLALLRQKGIDVLDLTETLLARRDEQMFCKTDSHWSGLACVLAAQKVAERLKPEANWTRENFLAETRPVAFTGDLVSNTPVTESIPLRFVTTAAGQPVKPSRTSPILLMGDSHCLVFHAGSDLLATGAGLPDQLALELGLPVDLLGVRGSGATPARLSLMRQARVNPDYLKSKRVVIWCFTVREFTESSGWSRVPLPLP